MLTHIKEWIPSSIKNSYIHYGKCWFCGTVESLKRQLEFLLPLVLFLLGRLRYVALKDEFPLLIHISFHASEGVISHKPQVWFQWVISRVIYRWQEHHFCVSINMHYHSTLSSGYEMKTNMQRPISVLRHKCISLQWTVQSTLTWLEWTLACSDSNKAWPPTTVLCDVQPDMDHIIMTCYSCLHFYARSLELAISEYK